MAPEQVTAVMIKMRALAPALNNVSDAMLETFIELASDFVCESRFGDKYITALALYTMHIMFLDGAMKTDAESVEDYSQRVKSFSLSGEFSQTFGEISATTETRSILRTPWGKMYDLLNKKKGGGFGLITGLNRGCF